MKSSELFGSCRQGARGDAIGPCCCGLFSSSKAAPKPRGRWGLDSGPASRAGTPSPLLRRTWPATQRQRAALRPPGRQSVSGGFRRDWLRPRVPGHSRLHSRELGPLPGVSDSASRATALRGTAGLWALTAPRASRGRQRAPAHLRQLFRGALLRLVDGTSRASARRPSGIDALRSEGRDPGLWE